MSSSRGNEDESVRISFSSRCLVFFEPDRHFCALVLASSIAYPSAHLPENSWGISVVPALYGRSTALPVAYSFEMKNELRAPSPNEVSRKR